MSDRNPASLAALARQVGEQHSTMISAFEEERAAEAALLAQIVDAVRPALASMEPRPGGRGCGARSKDLTELRIRHRLRAMPRRTSRFGRPSAVAATEVACSQEFRSLRAMVGASRQPPALE